MPSPVLTCALLGVLLGGLVPAQATFPSSPLGKRVDLPIIWSGLARAHVSDKYAQVSSQSEFDATWKAIGIEEPAPRVDFATYDVVVIVAQHASTRSSVRVFGAWTTARAVVLQYEVVQGFASRASGAPYCMALMRKPNRPLVLMRGVATDPESSRRAWERVPLTRVVDGSVDRQTSSGVPAADEVPATGHVHFFRTDPAGGRCVARIDVGVRDVTTLLARLPGHIDKLDFLPNGRFVVGTRTAGQPRVSVVDAAGLGRSIGPDLGRGYFLQVEAAKTGDRVACVIERHRAGESALYVDDGGPGSLRRLHPTSFSYEGPSPASCEPLLFRTCAWAPNGRSLAIESVLRVSVERHADTVEVNRVSAIDVLTLGRGVIRRVGSARRGVEWPSWSPDGRRLAWWAEDTLCVTEAEASESGGERALGRGFLRHCMPPKWSPNGKKILVSRGARRVGTASYEIVVVDVRTSATMAVRVNGQISGFDWSPDGKRIAIAVDKRLLMFVVDECRLQDLCCPVEHWTPVWWTE